MMMRKDLTDQVSVSPQIAPEDCARLAADGFTMLVNNRPDGEEEGQPTSNQMHRAAEAAGLSYAHVPIDRGISPGDIDAMRDALAKAGSGRTLAYCRSGTRSVLVWACAQNENGVAKAELEAAANSAGYSLAPIDHLLT